MTRKFRKLLESEEYSGRGGERIGMHDFRYHCSRRIPSLDEHCRVIY